MNNRPVFASMFSLAAAVLVAAAPAAATAQALDLAGAYRLAAENDPAFLAAGAERDAALESVAIAQAGLRPSVSFGGSATLESDDVNEPAGAKSDTYSNLSLSLDATQPLYRLDRTIRLGRAKTREEKAKADYAVRNQELIERVVERYFGVLEAGDDYRFAQTNREAIGQQHRQAQQRFEVGLIAITDVEEAKSRFDLASAREIEAKNGLDNAREAMRETIGEYPKVLASLGADIPLAVPDPADIDAWTETALERSLPVRSASLAVAIAKEDIRLASAGAQPTVDVVTRAAATDKNRKPPGGSEAISASVGLRLHWPLYTGGRVSAETREARAQHRVSMHIRERARRDAVRQTRQAYLGVESAIARVGALRQAVISSQSALDAVDAGFQVGTRTSVDVLDAQRDLFQARNDLAAARYDYIRNALKLRLAAGTLVPSDLDTINEWLE
jgi:outer membrane protein